MARKAQNFQSIAVLFGARGRLSMICSRGGSFGVGATDEIPDRAAAEAGSIHAAARAAGPPVEKCRLQIPKGIRVEIAPDVHHRGLAQVAELARRQEGAGNAVEIDGQADRTAHGGAALDDLGRREPEIAFDRRDQRAEAAVEADPGVLAQPAHGCDDLRIDLGEGSRRER